MWSNGIKTAFFQKIAKYRLAAVVCLSYTSLLNTSPKLDIGTFMY